MEVLPVEERPAIEDSYELSPMQQGMLYDTIQSARPGMYCIVVSYRLEGRLDTSALFRAWQTVVARHPVLRSSFEWRDRGEPVQLVHRAVIVPIVENDWRAIPTDEQRRRLVTVLQTENAHGFDVTEPPLIRLRLIQCADDVHELVVAHHHLLLDGSGKPLLFEEVFGLYDSFRTGEPFAAPPAEPYRRYIEWLASQDSESAEQFWREQLRGFRAPTSLPPDIEATPGSRDYDEHHVELDEAATARLRQFARTNRLTLNTLVSGAWALMLAHASGQDDVVFGATVNTRPADLDGVERMLGLFINTLPVRVGLSPSMAIAEWLRRIQLQQMTARDYDFAALSAIQQWSEVPRRLPLFESIVVFENNPGYGSDSERHGSVAITSVQAHIRNSLHLTLRCVPGRKLGMQLLYETARFSPATVTSIGSRLLHFLNDVTGDASRPVSFFQKGMVEHDRHRAERQAQAFQRTLRETLSQRLRTTREKSQ